jgi:hypothetical protein
MFNLKYEYFSLSNIKLLLKSLFIRESFNNKLTMSSFNEKPCSVKDDLPKIGNVVNKNNETLETLSNAVYKPKKSGSSPRGLLSSKSPDSPHNVRVRSRNDVNRPSSIKSEFGYSKSPESSNELRFVIDSVREDNGRERFFKTPPVDEGSFVNDYNYNSSGRNENIVRAPNAPRMSEMSTPSTMSPLFPNNNFNYSQSNYSQSMGDRAPNAPRMSRMSTPSTMSPLFNPTNLNTANNVRNFPNNISSTSPKSSTSPQGSDVTKRTEVSR